jgi:hypothetical protein
MDRKFTTLAKSLRSYLILGLLALCLTLAACDGDAPAEPAALPPAVDDMATTGPTPVAATTDQPSRQVATDTTTEVSPLITPTPFESPLMLPEGLNEGYIAFHSDQTGTLQIHSIDLESGLERQLTLPLALTEPDPITVTQGLPQVQRSFEPSWSPDCEQIVFTSERNKPGNFNVYVMNRDGSEQRPLLPDQDTPLGMLNWAPALSPTGDVVAYQTNQEGDLRICFVGIEGNPLAVMRPATIQRFRPGLLMATVCSSSASRTAIGTL